MTCPAEERARLANMALAEVGLPAAVCPRPTSDYPRKVMYVGAPSPVIKRAISLADLRLVGPDHLVTCFAHTPTGLNHHCRKVTVAEALLGHTCGAD